MAKIYRGIQIKLNHKAVSLRKCPYDHWLTDKAYFDKYLSEFYLQDGGRIQLA